MDEVICNENGQKLIKHFEGLHDGDSSTPLLEPMRDPVGIWTLAWGSIYDLDGRRVTADHRAITLGEADELFLRDIKRTEQLLIRLVQVDVSEQEWAAITSFAYNVGTYNFKCSTLRSRLNRSDKQGAASEFPRWRLGGTPKRILPGLVRRRAMERDLFLQG